MAQGYSSQLVINVNDLLDIQRVEEQRIEFKRSWNTGPTSWQVLHTICAFANDFLNDDGGYIILGVDDKPLEDGTVNVVGLTAESLDKTQKTITGLCKGHIKPEYQPRLSPEFNRDGKHLLVIWATPSENGPHQCRESANGEFQYYIRKGPTTVKAKEGEVQQLFLQHSKLPFDDRKAIDRENGKQLTDEDIDVSLVRDFLRGVGSKIEDQDLDSPLELYKNMRLVRLLGDKNMGGKLIKRFAPRNVALLFFHPTPRFFFPGARTEIALYDGNKNFIQSETREGPIDQQISKTLEYILSETKNEDESVPFVPYPKRALREAVVNALYHRGYEHEHADPMKVRIYPSHIDIISYPGPHQSLKKEHFMEDSEIPPVKTRNRRVGEFLMQRKLAEDKGTGVRTIFRAMKDNGNFTPVFQFDDTYFQVRLPGHPKFMVRDLLNVVNKLCASGEKQKAVKQLLGFLEQNPTVRPNSLIAKLLELHDLDKNHPSVLPYKDSISYRLERRLQLNNELSEWAASPMPLDASVGASIVQNLVENEADSDDLQKATEIAVKFLNEKEGHNTHPLEACQRAHQLFQAMGEVAKTDAYIAFQFGYCKFNLYVRNRKKKREEKLALVPYLREAEDYINAAISLTSEENTHHLARQNRLLGYIHSQLTLVKKSTVADVIHYYNKAREYNPDIHINETFVPLQSRNYYKNYP